MVGEEGSLACEFVMEILKAVVPQLLRQWIADLACLSVRSDRCRIFTKAHLIRVTHRMLKFTFFLVIFPTSAVRANDKTCDSKLDIPPSALFKGLVQR